MVKALPIKINSFRPRHQVYYVGIDGVFNAGADKYYISKVLMQKLIQICSYCKKYGKSVTAVLNSKVVPDYIPSLLSTLGVNLLSVVNDPLATIYSDFLVNEEPSKFIADNTEVVIVIKGEEDDYDVDTETPLVFIKYPTLSTREKRTDEPGEVVEGFNEVFRSNNNPYGVFDLGEQGRRVDDDYMERIMQAPEPTGIPKPLRRSSS
mgnify:CR=1 FL=1